MSGFVSEAALMVAQSSAIIRRLQNEYPKLSELFEFNRKGTIGFLKANGGLYGFHLSHNFNVDNSGENNLKTWSDYRDAIESYLEKICEGVKAVDPLNPSSEKAFKEHLRPARKILSNEIHHQHYVKFPLWPAVGCEQSSHVELDCGGAYDDGAYTLVWSCLGWINVIDRRPASNKYIAEFNGKPDLKLLAFDHDRLKELDETIARQGIEEGKKLVGKVRAIDWTKLK
ncbi:hypothetical protein Glove_123g159 [Diversispora epigaea]|uniref:Uncharacterized protein n=1 Tax=Diversispora epigaea TaxID=1348612 RepID=A0A397J7X8_9GLOM|nr:hypothetical protein Glove_123g159 [Diversispora epigaea]